MGSRLIKPRTRAQARTMRRQAAMRRLVMEIGQQDFRRRHGTATFAPVLVVIASYLEADNIGDVLEAVPSPVATRTGSARPATRIFGPQRSAMTAMRSSVDRYSISASIWFAPA